MKNKYEISQNSRIQQQPSSRQDTIQIKLNCSEGIQMFQIHSYKQRLRIIERLLKTNQPQQWKELMREWPNSHIRQLFEESGIVHLKNRVWAVGNLYNGMLHGLGLTITGPQLFYEGNFQNNVKHGQGYESMSKGVYIGSYVNGKADGKGRFYSHKGEQYQGQYVNGLKHGYGKWRSENQTYIGEWRANRPQGTGIIKNDISEYEGQIKEGIKHGCGKQQFRNGDKYTGSYVNGRPEGFGEYRWSANNTVFQGHFKNGLRHGKGLWSSCGDKYQGEYMNDKKCGKGQFRWANNNVYIGEYFNDLRHGYGQMKWNDGSWYKGSWKYGIQNGLGKLYEVGCSIRKGQFENNVLVQEDFDIVPKRKYKIQRIHDPNKKLTSRRLDIESQRKLPGIYREEDRRYTASLINKMPLGIIKPPRQYYIKKNSQTSYISQSQTDIVATKKIVRSLHIKDRRKTHRTVDNMVNNTSQTFDIIQWSNIYNIKTQPSKNLGSSKLNL